MKKFSVYPIKAEWDEGRFVLTSRDVPHFVWYADRKEDIESQVLEAFKVVFPEMVREGEPVRPASKPQEGEVLVRLPLWLVAKFILHNTMLRNHVAPSELARRLGVENAEVARLRSTKYRAKIDKIAEAVRAAGGDLELVGS